MTKQEFLTKYGKDHIIVYVGFEVQASFFSDVKEPAEGKYMLPVRNSSIYIDEMLYASSYNHPFACFDVGPGLHKLEIDGEYDGLVFTTDVRPARVKEGSSYMFAVKFVRHRTGVYRFIKEFTDIDEFLRHTGQRL